MERRGGRYKQTRTDVQRDQKKRVEWRKEVEAKLGRRPRKWEEEDGIG